MKKASFFIFIITLSIQLFNGCAAHSSQGTQYSLRQLAEASAASQSALPAMHYLPPSDSYFQDYISDIYRLDLSQVSDGAVFYAGGMLASEIAVLKMSDATAASEAFDLLTEYKNRRADAFAGYAPIESAMLTDSIVKVQGEYIALLICAEPEDAEQAFIGCFGANAAAPPAEGTVITLASEGAQAEAEPSPEPTVAPIEEVSDTPTDTPTEQPTEVPTEQPTEAPTEQPTETPVNEPSDNPVSEDEPGEEPEPPADQPGVYDHEAILLAAASNDDSNLSLKNYEIYLKCQEIIEEEISEDMSEYEMEWAIHEYLRDWVSYDSAVHDQGPNSNPDPDNNNPYGALINQKAICTGYAYSFQLIMEMLGFECITIEGSSPGGDHGWNMIVIDGQWYCVDVTWNDSGGRYVNFFNKSTKFFRDTGHDWDETAGYPIAPVDMNFEG